MNNTHIRLSNGINMPLEGIGTYNLAPGDDTYYAVLFALERGVRLIDTSIMYHNEQDVSRAIKDSGIDRHEIFITGKLPPHIKRPAGIKRMFERSLQNLDIEYFDAYIINAPGPFNEPDATYYDENVTAYKVLEQLYHEEKVAAIGVSRFQINHLRHILDRCDIVPHINQIAYFIGHTQPELVNFCHNHNIAIQAFSPFARGPLLTVNKVVEVANKVGKTPAQIALKFIRLHNIPALPKAGTNEHIIENTSLDFDLPEALLQELEAVSGDVRTYIKKKVE
jgi:diketogulonate reductase-like aldo/keto reductase